MMMNSFIVAVLFVTAASCNPLTDKQKHQESESRSWMPEDAPVLESSESDHAESSPVPATSSSETVTAAPTDKSSLMSDVLGGKSPLASPNGEKPEAFLIHFKPKVGQTSKSKYMLLLKLPDGSTETIESTSETLASDASQDRLKSVPTVEESIRSQQQASQSQFDDDLGFDLEPPSRNYGSAAGAAAGVSSGNRVAGSSAAAGAAAGGSSATASVSAGGAIAAIEQQILQQADDEQQLEADLPAQRPSLQDTQQKVNDEDVQQQQAIDDQPIEQQRDEEGGTSAAADPNAGAYGQQQIQQQLSPSLTGLISSPNAGAYGQQQIQQQLSPSLAGLTSSPNTGAVYTSYAGTPDQQVPVILIALPPRASANAQRQTLNRLLGALKSPATSAALSATKGLSSPVGALKGTRKGPVALRGKTSFAAAAPALAPTKGGRLPASPAVGGATKGGSVSGSLRILGPLSPVAQLAAKGSSGLRVKGTRGRSNTNSPENPQFPQPDGGFGGYGNSHTPSPSGGYGSLAMRLAAKGVPAPTERDVQRPATLKAILSLARQTNNAAAGRKGARLSLRTYA